jgi:hypothetical protein
VDNRARVIYRFLRENAGRGFKLDELLTATGLENSATTRRAIQRAALLAEQDGFNFPPAGPKNQNRYMVTANSQDTFEPTLNLRRIKHGVGRRERMGLDYMSAHPEHLTPAQAAAVSVIIAGEDAQNSMNAAMQMAVEALLHGEGAPA